jgi:hypothetical protein
MHTLTESSTRRQDARAVKARADFVAIAGRYTRLRRAGRQWRGLCPFHPERHPSFFIEPIRRIFYCFGCSAGGDLFDFVMKVERCDFRRALCIVANFPEGVARASAPRSGARCRAGVGAEPLGPRSGPLYIARAAKPQVSHFVNACRRPQAELPGGCAAEAAALLLVNQQITGDD